MDEEEEILSVDDSLEEDRGTDIPSVGDEPLEEDNDTPASPPDEVGDITPEDHPKTDSDLDSQEIYDQGSPSYAQIN